VRLDEEVRRLARARRESAVPTIGYIATDHAASAVGSDGTADENSKKGMLPGVLAERIADAVERGEPELIASQVSPLAR